MKTYVIGLLSDKDFYKLLDIDEKFSSYDLVLVTVNTKDMKMEDIEKWLKKKEIEKAESYISKIAKLNFIVSRAVVNYVFKDVIKTNIENLSFQRGENNKPFIENLQGIKFNISHTDGCVVVGFSKKEIGVDVEKVKRGFKFKDILKECFLDKEIAFIGDEHIRFFKYWTAKEAYLKCEGSGLTRNPKEIEIIYSDNSLIKVNDKKAKRVIRLESIELFDKYLGAICVLEDI